MSIDNEIIYRCKRGLLELDLLLAKFDKATLKKMTANDKLQLLKLFEINDNVLLKLLTNSKEYSSNDMNSLLKLIRDYSNHESKKKV